MRLLLALIVGIMLAACGSGGGDGGGSAAAVPPPANSRGIPGGSVGVAATADARLRITTDLAGVAALEALGGNDYATAIPLPVTADGSGAWTVQPGGAGSLLIRFRLGDGSIIETGRDDFPLR
jgi:hypothetical protein